MKHLSDWSFSEIVGHIRQGIESISIRDFLASVNLPKFVSNVPTRKGILELQNVSRRYTSVMAGMLRGIAHLPDAEPTGGNVVKCKLCFLLDCTLQVPDRLRMQNGHRKRFRIAGAENPAVERKFGGHVPKRKKNAV